MRTPYFLLGLMLNSSIALCQTAQRGGGFSFETKDHRKVLCARYGDAPGRKTIILLHGAGGAGAGGDLYPVQAAYFNAHGYNVVFPHYFDAGTSPAPTEEHYRLWEEAIESLIDTLRQSAAPPDIFLVGYSLGASVALSVGSQNQSISAVAEWYGSLPDQFFYSFTGMPPLLILHGERDTNIPVDNARQLIRLCGLKQLTCENHIYPDQAHGFDFSAMKDADERTLAFFARYAHPTTP